ncbi:hypothetical protein Zm00014a_002449 [Zea mays]|uniref:Uncharacterized protein n=1 Tax=Zea mays TaxID=4577 RepID=A0A3L6EHB5_MAIZE|nr:hypothetical protein Zm00014a_002449 [Zea mays]
MAIQTRTPHTLR